ncbi:MAG: CNNM domain-containing protein [Candidatus Micrarchaeia archaeon]
MLDFYAQAALLAALVAASAFFAATEVAFLSLSSVRLHSLVEEAAPGAESLARLRSKRRRVVISLLIGGNIANVAASALATSISTGLFGEAGVGIAIGLMSFLLLTFGDIAPKSAATTYGEKIALSSAKAIEAFYWLSFPLVVLFESINRLIPGVYSTATGIEQFTEAEVRSAVKLGAKHKGISEKERELIENVLEFNDRPVSRAMTPKSSAVMLSSEQSVAEAHKKAVWSVYSRFPVLTPQKKIVGTISFKALVRAFYEHPDWTVDKVCTKPVLLHTTDKLHNAFATLQSLGRNIAVVVDEKGEFAGVVTLEDILEELVGEIR